MLLLLLLLAPRRVGNKYLNMHMRGLCLYGKNKLIVEAVVPAATCCSAISAMIAAHDLGSHHA